MLKFSIDFFASKKAILLKKMLLAVFIIMFLIFSAGCDTINFSSIGDNNDITGESFNVSGVLVDESGEPLDEDTLSNARIVAEGNEKITTNSPGSWLDETGEWQLTDITGEARIMPVIDHEDVDYGSDPSAVIADEDRDDVVFQLQLLNFAGGDGSDDNSYIIENAEQLNDIRYALNRHFRLADDIELEEEWEPVGKFESTYHQDNIYFEGSFDGGGRKISGVNIDRSNYNGVGFFAALGPGAVVKDLIIEADRISGDTWVGGLAGRSYEAEIIRSAVIASPGNGIISGSGRLIGGLVGANRNAEIRESFAKVEVEIRSGMDIQAGGLAGYSNYLIHDSYATGNITGEVEPDDSAGGLIGVAPAEDNHVPSIINTYALGLINDQEGQLIGEELGGFEGAESSYYGEDELADGTFEGWDDEIWDFSGDYPVLDWEN